MSQIQHAGPATIRPMQIRVTAAEITRNFGMWQDKAALSPVVVTHHGRARCVLLSASSYEQLTMPDGAEISVSQDSLLLQVLAERIDMPFVVIDDHFCIREANTAAAILLGVHREILVSRLLTDMWPGLEDSVAQGQLRRAMRTIESTQVRLPLDGKIVHLNAFPWPGGLGLLMRTTSAEELMDHAAAEAEVIHRLLTLDRSLGTVKLSARGTIVQPDPGFCALTKIAADRLIGARFLDLVPRAGRAGLSSLIEQALSGPGEGRCCTLLIDNDGLEVPVHFTIASMREELGTDGALVLVRKRIVNSRDGSTSEV